jgi:hypothetical protein
LFLLKLDKTAEDHFAHEFGALALKPVEALRVQSFEHVPVKLNKEAWLQKLAKKADGQNHLHHGREKPESLL